MEALPGLGKLCWENNRESVTSEAFAKPHVTHMKLQTAERPEKSQKELCITPPQ